MVHIWPSILWWYIFKVEKFYLHPLYFSTHPIKKTHIGKYTFTLDPNISICLLLLLLLIYLSAPQLPYSSCFVCVLCTQLSSSSGFVCVRMALQNRENDVALSFTTVEKEDEDNINNVQILKSELLPDLTNPYYRQNPDSIIM